jgi:gamma-glutamyl-gamma-aminobutyraldehyde dehydrogenase
MQDKIDLERQRPVAARNLFIGGRWVAAESGKVLPVISPLDGKELTQIADAGAEDVDRAV